MKTTLAEQQALFSLLAHPNSPVGDLNAHPWHTLRWPNMLNSIDSNIFPYLHYVIKSRDLHELISIPDASWHNLSTARQATRLRQLCWSSQIKKIANCMQDAQVPLIILKGGDIKYRLYPDPSTRPMVDLDLLLNPAQFNEAQLAMKSAGFKTRYEPHEETPKENKVKPWEETKFYKIINQEFYVVELKCKAGCNPSADPLVFEELLHRSQPHSFITTTEARVLSATDLLHYLSQHLIIEHSCSRGLMWLLDIRLLVEKMWDQIDWELLEKIDSSSPTLSASHLAIHFSVPMLDVTSEKPINSADNLNRLTELAWQQFFAPSLISLPPPQLQDHYMGEGGRNYLKILIPRIKQWGSRQWSDSMGVKIHWWQIPGLMFRRLNRDLKTFRASWNSGGLRPDIIQGQIDDLKRATQIQNLIEGDKSVDHHLRTTTQDLKLNHLNIR